MPKKVVVIGCGFAGLTALELLSRFRDGLELTAIDKSSHTHFLPMLPDVIGRDIQPDFLTYPLADLSRARGFSWVHEPVEAVDLKQRRVRTSGGEFPYDYLIIAGGSETNFYDNEEIRKEAYKLDDAFDAAALRRALDEKKFDSYIIAGAGYTGIEIATNLRRYLAKRRSKKRIIIVERAPSILGSLPAWIKDYVAQNLKRLDIDVAVNTVINTVTPGSITLSNGETIRGAALIWAAGVKTAAFVQALNAEKNPQGRLNVDEYLRLNDSCFVAGDAANFVYKNNSLRMGVEFSMTEGACAAANIIRGVRGERLSAFKPFDLGYFVPMANNKACGIALGRQMRGGPAIALHYLMCLYRACGRRNRLGILRNLALKRRK